MVYSGLEQRNIEKVAIKTNAVIKQCLAYIAQEMLVSQERFSVEVESRKIVGTLPHV